MVTLLIGIMVLIYLVNWIYEDQGAESPPPQVGSVSIIGKARSLAGMSKYDFGRLLGERSFPRHYGREEMKDDLVYACSE